MADGLKPGLTGTLERVVEDQHCTVRGEHAVFSTPSMFSLLEEAADAMMRPYLAPVAASGSASTYATWPRPRRDCASNRPLQ